MRLNHRTLHRFLHTAVHPKALSLANVLCVGALGLQLLFILSASQSTEHSLLVGGASQARRLPMSGRASGRVDRSSALFELRTHDDWQQWLRSVLGMLMCRLI